MFNIFGPLSEADFEKRDLSFEPLALVLGIDALLLLLYVLVKVLW